MTGEPDHSNVVKIKMNLSFGGKRIASLCPTVSLPEQLAKQ